MFRELFKVNVDDLGYRTLRYPNVKVTIIVKHGKERVVVEHDPEPTLPRPPWMVK